MIGGSHSAPRRRGHAAKWVVLACAVGCLTPATLAPPQQVGIWITTDEVQDLPMSGPAWDALLQTALVPAATPNLSDMEDPTNVQVLAKALLYARTGDQSYRDQVADACLDARETENDGDVLALARNLAALVIAADIVRIRNSHASAFKAWLEDVRHEDLAGRTLISTHEDRANNWGTHAGASRMAVALYLGDDDDLAAAADVFKGWLGDRDTYAGFTYGELWWQADPLNPVGINPLDATIDGLDVDGVLPDDLRRGGPLQWPPPDVSYVYEALQGAVVQAVILDRQGYDVWNWEDQALLRAFKWLRYRANVNAQGDDRWQPYIINRQYGTLLPTTSPAQAGKNMGWTDWTHPSCNADLDGDGEVGITDLQQLITAWGTNPGGPPDFNRNGNVKNGDLLDLIKEWGPCN